MLLLQREADGTSCQNKLDSLLKEGVMSALIEFCLFD